MKDIKLNTPQEVMMFMYSLGFTVTENIGIFYHKETGIDFLYDISATGNEAWQIQLVIMKRLIEFGEAKKLNEIQTVLNIKN